MRICMLRFVLLGERESPACQLIFEQLVVQPALHNIRLERLLDLGDTILLFEIERLHKKERCVWACVWSTKV